MSTEPISRIDHEKGKLYFRGLDATELARTRSFNDVAYLLIYGQLPNDDEGTRFQEKMLNLKQLLDNELPTIVQMIGDNSPRKSRRNIEGIDRTEMMGLRTWAKHLSQVAETHNLEPLDTALAFVAQCPAVLAAGWRHVIGKPFISPRHDLSHSHNFLWMMTETELPLEEQRDLDACFILHMDDPENQSLNALENSIKSNESISSSLVAALDHHIDPLHHGAGEESMRTIMEIEDSRDVEAYLSNVLDDGKRIYGLGHRRYRTIDPRAVVLQEILKRRTKNQAADSLYHKIEETARIGSELIRQRKNRVVFPNIDLYNAAVYHTFGIPYYLNTELFAVSRAAGWAAHIAEWLELV